MWERKERSELRTNNAGLIKSFKSGYWGGEWIWGGVHMQWREDFQPKGNNLLWLEGGNGWWEQRSGEKWRKGEIVIRLGSKLNERKKTTWHVLWVFETTSNITLRKLGNLTAFLLLFLFILFRTLRENLGTPRTQRSQDDRRWSLRKFKNKGCQ